MWPCNCALPVDYLTASLPPTKPVSIQLSNEWYRHLDESLHYTVNTSYYIISRRLFFNASDVITWRSWYFESTSTVLSIAIYLKSVFFCRGLQFKWSRAARQRFVSIFFVHTCDAIFFSVSVYVFLVSTISRKFIWLGVFVKMNRKTPFTAIWTFSSANELIHLWWNARTVKQRHQETLTAIPFKSPRLKKKRKKTTTC